MRDRLADDVKDPFAKICDVELDHREGCQFDARFVRPDGGHLLEGPVLVGPDEGPDAVTLFTLSSAYCLVSSLNYWLAIAHVSPEGLTASGHANMRLTPEQFRRIESLEVDIHVTVARRYRRRLERGLERFTQLCIINESVRGAFPVRVRVHHPWGVHEQVIE